MRDRHRKKEGSGGGERESETEGVREKERQMELGERKGGERKARGGESKREKRGSHTVTSVTVIVRQSKQL